MPSLTSLAQGARHAPQRVEGYWRGVLGVGYHGHVNIEAQMASGAHSPSPPAGFTPETVTVDERVLACDGSGGPLGHPRVWLRIEGTQTFCPYCSRIFVLAPGAGDGHGH